MVTNTILDRDIAALFTRAQKGASRGWWIGWARRLVAYGLKIVAAGGSLLVATAWWPEQQQQIGMAILVAILIDSVTSNHKRLVSTVKAGYAYKALADNIGLRHNRELDPLVEALKKAAEKGADGSATEAQVADLKSRTQKDLSEGLAAIDDGVAKDDIKALEAISLDNERAAARQS